MAKYIAEVIGLTNTGALWFDSATTYEEMVRDMGAIARSDPRIIFVKLYIVHKLSNTDVSEQMANKYLYAGAPDPIKGHLVQHFFYAHSHKEALEAARVWSWKDGTLYACTEIKQ